MTHSEPLASSQERETRRPWTSKEGRALRKLYPHMRTDDVCRILGRSLSSVYVRAQAFGITKSAAYNASPLSGRIVKGFTPYGKRSRFPKGHVPWNAGVHWVAGGRSAETRFKKGSVSANYQPAGTLRLNADGYVDLKVQETGLRGWRAFHIILWEDANGPVPKGHVIVFKDKDRLNLCLENFECITRAELARRNRMWTLYPKPLASTLHVLGQLKRRIRERSERAT